MPTSNQGSADAFPTRHKIILCVRRRSDLSRNEFPDWLDRHAARMSARRAEGVIPQVQGYLQNHTVDAPLLNAFRNARGMIGAPFDALIELDLGQLGDADAVYRTADNLGGAAQLLIDDDARFIDLPNSCVLLTAEHSIFGEPRPQSGFKMIICVRRRGELSRDQFQLYWLNNHGPLAQSVRDRGLTPPIENYIQNHTIDSSLFERSPLLRDMATGTYDGVTEVWYKSPADLDVSDRVTPELIAADKTLIDDEAKFVDFSSSSVFLTAEHRLF